MISSEKTLAFVVLLSWISCLVQSASLNFDGLDAFTFDKDSQIVQSLIREVRAAPHHVQELVNPDTQKAYLHNYDNGDGDDQGYRKRSQDEGGKGYKHFDSYHKKDGDKYGFQHQTSFGLENKDEGAAIAQSGKYEHEEEEAAAPLKEEEEENDREDEETGKLQQEQEADGDEDESAETKNTYKVIEDVGEYYDGGAGSGGNYDEAADTGHYESSSDAGDESGHYTEGDDDGESREYSESEGYTNDDGDDEESEHYETAEGDDDY